MKRILITVAVLGCRARAEQSEETFGADFPSMSACLTSIETHSGQALDVITDTPEQVSGRLSNDKFFSCTLRVTGTRGIFFEARYTATKDNVRPAVRTAEDDVIDRQMENEVLGELGSPDAPDWAEIGIPSDSSAKHYLLKRSGSKQRPVFTTKRVSKGGVLYAKREFDCAARTWRYLGEGETKQEMASTLADMKMSPLVDGSIADVYWGVACR